MGKLDISILEGPGQIPVHLQILYSLEYAMGFGLLTEGTKLPSVRELAVQLGVAPNTVARAYQQLQEEGLVRTRAGRGTFVRAPYERQRLCESRTSTLREILEPAVRAARAIGFPASRIKELVHELASDVKVTVGFVGVNRCIVEKWSGILKREFDDLGTEVIGLTLDEVWQNPAEAALKLQPTSCLFTLTSTWSEVVGLLRAEGLKTSALLSELSGATHQELARLPDVDPIGLICRDFYVSSLFNILSAYVDLDRLRRVSPEDQEGMEALFSETDVIVHTLASAEKVVPLAGPRTHLIELEFVPNRAAFEQLRQRLHEETCSR